MIRFLTGANRKLSPDLPPDPPFIPNATPPHTTQLIFFFARRRAVAAVGAACLGGSAKENFQQEKQQEEVKVKTETLTIHRYKQCQHLDTIAANIRAGAFLCVPLDPGEQVS